MNPPAGPGPGRAVAPPVPLYLLGVPFHNVTLDETFGWMTARARAGGCAQIVTCNLDFIMQAWRDPEMHRIHVDADLVVADGWPPVVLSRFFGPRLRARVAGSDLVQRLGEFARDHDLSVYALGGQEGVAAEALRILQTRAPGFRVAGWASPPVSGLLEMDHDGLCDGIVRARPDILLVALGAPKQDKWIRMNAPRLGSGVAIGVGGSLDFIAGVQRRAPRWVQAIGLEWFWRLARQPRRLFKRYSANMIFLTTILVRLALARLLPAGARPPAPDATALGAGGAALAALPALRDADEAASFCAAQEPVAAEKPLVVDLSGRTWLDSLELGALSRLAHASRRGGRRLLVWGACTRVTRLLRLMRLDRCVDLARSVEDVTHLLDPKVAGSRQTQWDRQDAQLRILLAEEFDRDEAERALATFRRFDAGGEVRRVVVDGRRLRYLESGGLRFLRTTWRTLGARAGSTMSLSAFGADALQVLRREGLGAIPTEDNSTK